MATAGGEDKVGEDGIVPETMKDFCKNAITSVFDDQQVQPYDHNDAQQWVAKICETIIEKCMKAKKPYKYIANCIIEKKVGSGLHIASSSHFSPTDGCVCEPFTSSPELYVVVTVWWLSL